MRDRMIPSLPLKAAVTVACAAALLAIATGCNKKADAAKKAAEADSALVLPDPPELDSLESLDETISEDDFVAEPAADAKPQGSAAASSAKPTGSKDAKAAKAAPAAPAAPSKGLSPNGAYTLQVGIYNNQKAAQKRVDALIAQGLPAYSAHVRDPKPDMPGDYFRVRVGSFASSAAARAYGEANLAPAGIEFWADLKDRTPAAVSSPAPRVAPAAPAPAPAPKTAPPAPTPPPAAPSAPPAEAPAPPPAPSAPSGDTAPAPKLPDW